MAMMISLLGFGNVQAQEWTWTDPVPVTSPFLKEVAANPVTGELYGIDNGGNLIMPIAVGPAVTGLSATPSGLESVVNDIAIAFTGAIFICTEIDIRGKEGDSFVALVQQPGPPEDPGNPGNILQGKYTHITIGQGGTLYVLYQIDGTEDQYLMVGTPPVTSDGVVINIHPETLNLGSRGRWVTCLIDLPDGFDENDIVLETVKISRIEIAALAIDEAVDIPVAPGAPWNVALVDGKQVLKVKFPRYDKKNPGNPQSLIGKLRELLTAAGADRGFYQVTLTVDVQLASLEQFTGTDEIRIKLRHNL